MERRKNSLALTRRGNLHFSREQEQLGDLPSASGLLARGVPGGSAGTPWHPVEDPLDPLQIGKAP